jgi:hypothetical protein
MIWLSSWCACGLVGLALDYLWNRTEWMLGSQPGVTLMAMGLCVLIGPIGLVLAIVAHRNERTRWHG